jgi:phytoene dehydrogenase-like protein
MQTKTIAIIGAGLAGLAAGVYAQMNGYCSIIFEHHSQPGGVAAWWRRGAYHVDGGIHFLMGHRAGQPLYELYRTLGAATPDSVVDMKEYGAYVDEATGKSVLLSADLPQIADALCRLSPADAKALTGLFAAAQDFRSAAVFDLGMGNPPELAGRLSALKQYWGMRGILKYFVGPYSRTAAEFARDLHDPMVRCVIENLFLPEVPVWFLLMLLGLLANRHMGLLTTGCEGFVRPIEARYRALGGEVRYRARVERILVEGDRTVGVQLADGERIPADVVISAADGRSTLFDLLDGRYIDAKTQARYRDWKPITPWMMLSYGVAREFPGEPHFTTYRLAEPITVGSGRVDLLGVRVFNFSSHFAPPGKTVIQPSFETSWSYWDELLRRDRGAYEAEKARVSAEVLRRLEAHYPGLSSQVEMTDVATPYTTWRYTYNWQGAYQGWRPSAAQMVTTLPRTLPGLSGFIMAGQWVTPGGGVPTVLISGRDAIRILCRQEDRTFVAG